MNPYYIIIITERNFIGRLDRGLDEASDRGWVVVNMKNDWNLIFTED